MRSYKHLSPELYFVFLCQKWIRTPTPWQQKKNRILHKLSVSTIPNALNRSAMDGRRDQLIFVANHDAQAVQK